MRAKIHFTLLIAIALLATWQTTEAQDRNLRNNHSNIERSIHNRGTSNHYGHERYRTQPIRKRPHYRYPRHRRYVRTLPIGYSRLYYGGLNFYFHAGFYYTLEGDSYAVVLPPAGYRIAVLPNGYVRVFVGPRVFFYHSGIYYIKIESESDEEQFEIVTPPLGGVVDNLPEEADEVLVDGKTLYNHNSVLYKMIYLEDGQKAYEIIYVPNEN